ncbi:MAG: hypothetical protein P9L99_05215 [Candidatus Lernaella stagnicola]|nr:hypothetical protein [Candidatus Lernaella stagnicola]
MIRLSARFLLMAVLCLFLLAGCSVKELIEDLNEFAQDNILDGLVPGDAAPPLPDLPGGGEEPLPGPAGAGDDDDDDNDNNDNDNDDNNDDDDNDDDDNDDNDTSAPLIDIVDGGLPGNDGTGVARLPNGTVYVTAVKEERLYLYARRAGLVSREWLASDAASPVLAVDVANRPHVAYRTTEETPRLIHMVKEDGVWRPSVVAEGIAKASPGLFVDPGGIPHVLFGSTDHGIVYAYLLDGAWVSETVESAATTSAHVSVAVDRRGAVHAAYAVAGEVTYALRDGSWNVTRLATGSIGSAHALRLGPDDQPRLAYRSGGALWLGVYDGATWQTDVVDNHDDAGRFASLAVDDQGVHHLVYADGVLSELRYASDDRGAFESFVVAASADEELGGWTDLSVGADGVLHAGYFATEGLGLAERDGDSWNLDYLDGSGVVGLYAAVAADAAGDTVAAYFDLTNHRLKLARRDGPDWNVEVVDQSADTGYYPSLALDDAGYVHVAYYDRDHARLMYTTNLLGPWTPLVVDGDGDTGLNPSLALDEAGRAHISYFSDAGFGTLRYATNRDGPWETITIDNAGDMGFYSDIVVSVDDTVRIAYADRTHGAVKLAENVGGVWKTEVVDASQFSGAYVNLLVDNTGATHLVYRAELTGALRYARRDAGDSTWRPETIATPGLYFSPAAALDAQGVVHVMYYLAAPSQVMHAWGVAGVWSEEIFDVGPVLSGGVDLEIDAAGWLHVAYGGSASLKIGLRHSGKQWK